MNLYEKLKLYSRSDVYPFHMPGHKRHLGAVEEVRKLDITEIDGFDNLHHAEEILKDAQERAAKLYASEDTYYLINGSTCGILSAIFAATSQRGKILMARNCHKAAYHAAQLRELDTVYLYPKEELKKEIPINGVIDPEEVKKALMEDPEIEAVFITSPTYEGVVSEVKKIAEIVHAFGKPLIVDEAHGAHFGFHPYFPENSVKAGADLVIHSLHKTLPSLTQTALLHRNGTRITRESIKKYLGIFQTSSPSYVLMASMDECICLLEMDKERLFAEFEEKLKEFYRCAAELRRVKVLAEGGIRRDLSKIVVSVPEKNGIWLGDILRKEFHLEPEMETEAYVVLLTSIADTKEGFERLLCALQNIDQRVDRYVFSEEQKSEPVQKEPIMIKNRKKMTIAEADVLKKESILLEQAAGAVSGEYLYLYPPGIPLIVPGEEISLEWIQRVLSYRQEGFSLQGLEDYNGKCISVLKKGVVK